jgi:short-subunit dehydrogenase
MTSIVPIVRKTEPYAWRVDLRGAVVVVTGASAGIGEATALRFARAGSRTVLAARRLERLEALAGEIGSRGGEAVPVRCDVTQPEDVAALVESTMSAYGRCDVLVNNAGIPGGGAFRDLSVAQIERLVRVNLLGVLLVSKAFLPSMLERGAGHVVNIASIAGRVATPGAAVYGATKHGVVAFSEALSAELRPFGILVTSVNPGLTRTEGFPQVGRRRPFVMLPDRVADTIVDVVRRERAPEVSVPRVRALLQVFRLITPPLYRWGMNAAARRYAGRRRREE